MKRWNHWRDGAHDATPFGVICLFGFALGVAAMGLGELLLAVSS